MQPALNVGLEDAVKIAQDERMSMASAVIGDGTRRRRTSTRTRRRFITAGGMTLVQLLLEITERIYFRNMHLDTTSLSHFVIIIITTRRPAIYPLPTLGGRLEMHVLHVIKTAILEMTV